MAELTATEAAKTFSVGKSTLRRWATEGRIKAKKNQTGIWLFDMNSINDWMAASGKRPKQSKPTQATRPTKTSSELEFLKEQLKREQEKNDKMAEKYDKLQSELVKMAHEMQALLKKEDKGLLSRWLRS